MKNQHREDSLWIYQRRLQGQQYTALREQISPFPMHLRSNGLSQAVLQAIPATSPSVPLTF